MSDDIDIEEHDVMDSSHIKGIFPDLELLKNQILDKYDTEYEDTATTSSTPKVVPDSTTDDGPANDKGTIFYGNKIILGKKRRNVTVVGNYDEKLSEGETCADVDENCMNEDGKFADNDESYVDEETCLDGNENFNEDGSYVDNPESYVNEDESNVNNDDTYVNNDDSFVNDDDNCINDSKTYLNNDESCMKDSETCIDDTENCIEQGIADNDCADGLGISIGDCVGQAEDFDVNNDNDANADKFVKLEVVQIKNDDVIVNCVVNAETGKVDEKCDKSVLLLDDWGPYLSNSKSYCSECEILFATVNAYDYHKMQAHSYLVAMTVQDFERFKCKDCNANFESNAELINHQASHKKKEETKETNCFVCQKLFLSKDELVQHIYAEHIKKYTCDVCSKEFMKKTLYEEHILAHKYEETIRKMRVYRCKRCQCQFKKLGHYQRHSRLVHSVLNVDMQQYPYKSICHYCDKSFDDIHCYNKHVISNHLKNKVLVYGKIKASNLSKMESTEKYKMKHCNQCKCSVLCGRKGVNITPHAKGDCVENESEKRYCNICGLYMLADKRKFHLLCHKVKPKFQIQNFSFHDMVTDVPIPPPIPSLTKCKTCGIYNRALIRSIHKCDEPFETCQDCNIKIAKDLYPIHLKYHRLQAPKTELKKPVKETLENTYSKIVYCNKCKCCLHMYLYTMKDKNIHLTGGCSAVKNKVPCRYCNLLFSTARLAHHVWLHEKQGMNIASYSFYDTNLKRISAPIPKFSSCKSCKVHFQRPREKNLHEPVCGTKELKTEVCSYCNITLVKSAYDVHMGYHGQGAKFKKVERKHIVYQCENCNTCVIEIKGGAHSCDAQVVKKCEPCDMILSSNYANMHSKMHKTPGFSKDDITVIKFNPVFQVIGKNSNERRSRFYRCANCQICMLHKDMTMHVCSINVLQEIRNCRICNLTLMISVFEDHQKWHKHKDLTLDVIDFRLTTKIKPVDRKMEAADGKSRKTAKKYVLYWCDSCFCCTQYKSDAYRHAQKACWTTNVEECRICDIKIGGDPMLKRHRMLHRQRHDLNKNTLKLISVPNIQVGIFFCKTCGVNTLTDKHVCDKKRKHNCEQCKLVFHEDEFKQHLKDHQTYIRKNFTVAELKPKVAENVTLYKCSCDLHFLHLESGMKHAAVCSGVAKNPLECAKCMRNFDASQLFKHSLKHHQHADVEFRVQNLKVKTAEGAVDFFFCSKCNINFISYKTFYGHYTFNRCSEDTKKERCEMCQLDFSSSLLIQKHLSLHHSTSITVNVYDFTEKPKNGKRRRTLLSSFVTEVLDEISAKNLYECTICKVYFAREDNWKIHAKECRTVTKHKCDQCSRDVYSEDIGYHNQIQHAVLKINEFNVIEAKPKIVVKTEVDIEFAPRNEWKPRAAPKQRADANSEPRPKVEMDPVVTNSEGKIVTYRCRICDVSIFHLNSFKRHNPDNPKKHQTLVKIIKCEHCGLKFGAKNISYHIKHHHEDNKYTIDDFVVLYSVDQEPLSVGRPKKRDRDIESPLPEPIKSLKRNVVSPQGTLKREIESPLPEPKKSLKRNVDGPQQTIKKERESPPKKRVREDDIYVPEEKRSRTETKEIIEVFKCRVCDVCFISKDSCTKHLFNHKMLSEFDSVVCKLCSQNFLLNEIKNHMRLHRNIKNFDINNVIVNEYNPSDNQEIET